MDRTAYRTPAGSVSRLYLDMLEQPHLLIAGSTGSGKSTALHGVITAALYDSPARRRFIMIDPKRVELSEYSEIPHTITTARGYNPNAWIEALSLAAGYMDARYLDMERRHMRDYDGSHIYVVIDEYAAIARSPRARDAYRLVMRLTSEGRAARVHCIISTQVPKADIVRTEIRENCTGRLCLRCNTRAESRVLMDAPGCDTLPQYGEGYYITPAGRTLYKIPLVTEDERRRLIRHWTAPAGRPRTA